jgi:hypothetical protein
LKIPKTKLKEKFFSQKEIWGFLNNSIIAQKQVAEYSTVSRQTKLRNYMEALIEFPLEHLEEGLLTPEELSFILSSAAIFIYETKVIKK